MDLQFALGLLFGGIVSWVVAHLYYRRSNKDQTALFKKLSVEVRDAILADHREKFTVVEL